MTIKLAKIFKEDVSAFIGFFDVEAIDVSLSESLSVKQKCGDWEMIDTGLYTQLNLILNNIETVYEFNSRHWQQDLCLYLIKNFNKEK